MSAVKRSGEVAAEIFAHRASRGRLGHLVDNSLVVYMLSEAYTIGYQEGLEKAQNAVQAEIDTLRHELE